jgi:hypothetical protein
MPIRRRLWRVFPVLVCVVIYELFLATPAGPRSLRAFDPDRTADLEVDMWRVYYAHRNVHLFADLVTMLHEENRYPWSTATIAAFHLARAASTFATERSGYDALLPDLASAYTTARDWTHASFDPAAVAHAELAWWKARRVDGENSPEQVGGLIADENALLFEVPRERVLAASILRAQAGRRRDDGGANADWATISTLLHESYHQLHDAVNH